MVRLSGWVGLLALCVACSGKTTGGVVHGDGTGNGGGTSIGGGTGIGGEPNTTNFFVDTLTLGQVTKVDLLLMVDNSIAMADKESLLAASIPDLVQRLTSPPCVDPSGAKVPNAPADPAAACPAGSTRAYAAISDIHIGVITSSLGDHGENDTCLGNDSDPIGEQQDDHGHLIASRPRFALESARNYSGTPFQAPDPSGFLDWNPATRGGNQDVAQFNTTFKMMVTASSEFGCGLQSQLEAVYRFLSDPNPPQSISKEQCPNAPPGTNCAFPTGIDAPLLAERAAFLRPDSAVVVALVTHKSDCSIRDTQQFFYAARTDIVLPNATSVCATNPNDPCCFSCASHGPAGCGDPKADPNCQAAPIADNDPINLRCFHDRQRFGLDFLYPTKRYVNALRSPQLCTSQVGLDFDLADQNTCPDANADGKPDIVQNPLYTNPNGLPRSSSLVYLAGVVGVPWQDIQAMTDRKGNPYPPSELHYMPASDLLTNGIWDRILGDPSASPPVLPTDGLMVESNKPRNGIDANGIPIPGPSATPFEDNGMNGHDWADNGGDDIMYACIFPLPASRDCAVVEQQKPAPGCDCGSAQAPGDNNPLCRDPATGNYGTVQYAAKAYPGTRELQVLKDFGANAIVTSICARNTTDGTAPDYAYRPAMTAITDRLADAFAPRCLPRSLPTDGAGNTTCKIFEVAINTGAKCDPARGRSEAPAGAVDALLARLTNSGICGGTSGVACGSFNLCELAQLGASCHQSTAPADSAGFCYIDPAQNPSDDASLVAQCAKGEERLIRFVDPQNETPAHGAILMLLCGAGL